MIKVFAHGREIHVSRLIFSGGEVQPRLEGYANGNLGTYAHGSLGAVVINALIRNSDDVMALLLVTDAIRRDTPDAVIDLVCPYLPYARQDRVCYPGEALALRVFCDLINSQNYNSVEVWDAHSDVALALLNRVRHVPASDILLTLPPLNNVVLVAPDAGAAKRVLACAKKFNVSMVQAEKVRDTKTGAITETVVNSAHIDDKDFLIVDDICDGGRTFIELAKKLRPLTNGKVNLYVTHGIFSQGFEVFEGLIDTIYVANSFKDDLPAFVKAV